MFFASCSSNPNKVKFPIPSNDDSSKSIKKILEIVTSAIKEGLNDRESDIRKKDEKKPIKEIKETIEK